MQATLFLQRNGSKRQRQWQRLIKENCQLSEFVAQIDENPCELLRCEDQSARTQKHIGYSVLGKELQDFSCHTWWHYYCNGYNYLRFLLLLCVLLLCWNLVQSRSRSKGVSCKSAELAFFFNNYEIYRCFPLNVCLNFVFICVEYEFLH